MTPDGIKHPARPAAPFDDYLGLGETDFGDTGLIVFSGCSGAGKSSYISWLLKCNPAFSGQPVSIIDQGRPLDWSSKPAKMHRLVVVDEVLSLRDMPHLVGLLRRGHRMLVASHLPLQFLAVMRIGGLRCRFFRLDRHEDKIRRALSQAGLTFSDTCLHRFIRTYGANYTDLDLILQGYQGDSFDDAWRLFHKFNSVKRIVNLA